MNIGVSSACFYPEQTEVALRTIQDMGVSHTEVFLNTFQELTADFLYQLRRAAPEVSIDSVHPFTSGLEPFLFATPYEQRFFDGLELYKRYFNACNILGAKILVFHGDYLNGLYPMEQYCENYGKLRLEAERFGVELAMENVSRCKSGYIENLEKMLHCLKDDISFVLDLKQARRANTSWQAIANCMQHKIVHVHVSDATEENDCLPPGEGEVAFSELFETLQKQGFNGTAMIELYRGDFAGEEALQQGAAFLENCL